MRCDQSLDYNQACILNDSAVGHAEYSKETSIHIGLFPHAVKIYRIEWDWECHNDEWSRGLFIV